MTTPIKISARSPSQVTLEAALREVVSNSTHIRLIERQGTEIPMLEPLIGVCVEYNSQKGAGDSGMSIGETAHFFQARAVSNRAGCPSITMTYWSSGICSLQVGGDLYGSGSVAADKYYSIRCLAEALVQRGYRLKKHENPETYLSYECMIGGKQECIESLITAPATNPKELLSICEGILGISHAKLRGLVKDVTEVLGVPGEL